jgi:hypothetical protein
MAERITSMVDSTILHNPLDIPIASIPKWLFDCVETARRVWMIVEFKPSNQKKLSTGDDEFMRWLWKE